MADSCDYYGKELAATNDSIYIIYPNQGAERQLVHCVGLQNRNSSGVRQFPIHSPGKLQTLQHVWVFAWRR